MLNVAIFGKNVVIHVFSHFRDFAIGKKAANFGVFAVILDMRMHFLSNDFLVAAIVTHNL